jgi:predicted transcriptional regulator
MVKQSTIAITFRCSAEVVTHLDELAFASGLKRGEVISDLIESKYDHLQGSPKFKAAMKALKEMSAVLATIDY